MKISISNTYENTFNKWIIDLNEVSLEEILYCINEQYPIKAKDFRRIWK